MVEERKRQRRRPAPAPAPAPAPSPAPAYAPPPGYQFYRNPFRRIRVPRQFNRDYNRAFHRMHQADVDAFSTETFLFYSAGDCFGTLIWLWCFFWRIWLTYAKYIVLVLMSAAILHWVRNQAFHEFVTTGIRMFGYIPFLFHGFCIFNYPVKWIWTAFPARYIDLLNSISISHEVSEAFMFPEAAH